MGKETAALDRESSIASGTLIDPNTKAPAPYRIRNLGTADLDAFLELHQAVLGTLGHPSCLDERDQGYMAEKISGTGAVAGAWLGGRLIGYACLNFGGSRALAYAEACGINGREAASVAEMDGAAVAPGYRRTGLYQSLLKAREHIAAEHSKRHLLGIVSVHNPRSLTGVLVAGYRSRALYHDHFGANLLIHRDLQVFYRPDQGGTRLRVRMNDVQGHEHALATSRWGCALLSPGERAQVEYARCLPEA